MRNGSDRQKESDLRMDPGKCQWKEKYKKKRWHRDWWGMGKGKESACNAGGSGLGWKELGGVLVRKDAKPMWVWRGGWTNTCANQIALSQSTEEDTDISMISKECLDWEVFWFVWSSTSLNADRDSCFLNASISPNSWKLWIHKTLSVMDSFVYILWDHRKNWTSSFTQKLTLRNNINDGGSHLFSIYCVSSPLIGNLGNTIGNTTPECILRQTEIRDTERFVYLSKVEKWVTFGWDVNYVRGCQLQEAVYLGGCICVCVLSCLTLCVPFGYNPPGSFVHGIFPGKNTGVGGDKLIKGGQKVRMNVRKQWVWSRLDLESNPSLDPWSVLK